MIVLLEFPNRDASFCRLAGALAIGEHLAELVIRYFLPITSRLQKNASAYPADVDLAINRIVSGLVPMARLDSRL
jgi:hypothetical protein